MSATGTAGLVLVRLERPDDAEAWRSAARTQLLAGVRPEDIVWESGAPTADLFADSTLDPAHDSAHEPAAATRKEPSGRMPRVPRSFVDLAERVVCHRDADRFALLYRVLWRLTHGESHLMDRRSDPDVHRLQDMGKRIARERHKMHAFVRFRQTPGVEPEHFGAWFEPEHHTLRLSSGFFVRRFSNMRWSIVTPEESAHWDTETLVFGPGGVRGELPDEEAMETLWRTYFANIFNPARLRLDAMRSEMPVKYWKNLPEASLIADLVHDAGHRTDSMIEAEPSEPPRFAAHAVHPAAQSQMGVSQALTADGQSSSTPGDAAEHEDHPVEFESLTTLHEATLRCMRCEHACQSTTAVNGEGPADAQIMLVGEQAGDREDLAGRPFVGPAGSLLRELLDEIGVDPVSLFLTNAVRHFRHEVRGKRRLHRTPTIEHVSQCRPFLFEEIRLVQPRVIVALGATAGQALLGRPLQVNKERGRSLGFGADRLIVPTAHPASVLRTPEGAARKTARSALRKDLAFALSLVDGASVSSAAGVAAETSKTTATTIPTTTAAEPASG